MIPLFPIFFWSFNVCLLLIVWFGFVPFLATELIADTIAGNLPWNFLVAFMGLVSVPTTTISTRLIPRHRRQISLSQVFLGIEAPLLIVCVIRVFLVQDLTPPIILMMLTIFVGSFSFSHWILQPQSPTNYVYSWIHLVTHSLMFSLSVYFFSIFIFFLPILLEYTYFIFFVPIFLPFLLIPLTLIIMFIGMPIVYFQAMKKTVKTLVNRYNRQWVRGLIRGVIAIWISLFILLSQQPQVQTWQLLEHPPKTTSSRQELLDKSKMIRKGLLNSYLAEYRYGWIDNNSIHDIYANLLPLGEDLAYNLQSAFDFLIYPLSYHGDWNDQEEAANLYSLVFDQSILRGEHKAVHKAISSTWDRGGAKAGLDDINQERVLLESQDITVKSHQNWAEVEIHEVYQNQTTNLEEILYYFSLPESTVITGLWLGESGDRATRFPFRISYRGAAQQVYQEQVRRSVDPALLEQVGPRNYRLRAFPIPRRNEGKMHLWLTYKVLANEGKWPIPQLAEKRNIYWNKITQRTVNGDRYPSSDQWIPSLPADITQSPVYNTVFPDGTLLKATPITPQQYQLPQNQRLAVIVDGSYSMNQHRKQVQETLSWLAKNVQKDNKLDLYLTSLPPVSPQRWDDLSGFDSKELLFYGTMQPSQMLEQFLSLQGDSHYDGILFLTDSGSYELTSDKTEALTVSAPLWFIHLGGMQMAYDDATLQAIQSSGGSAVEDVQTAIYRMGTPILPFSLSSSETLSDIVDGYAWTIQKEIKDNQLTLKQITPTGFDAIAAGQFVQHLISTTKLDSALELEGIHEIAKNYGIVTPYSSMIVLVNDQQHRRLDDLESREDRFDREVEDQQLPSPSRINVSGVPEPEEWVLMIVGTIVLLGLSGKKLINLFSS